MAVVNSRPRSASVNKYIAFILILEYRKATVLHVVFIRFVCGSEAVPAQGGGGGTPYTLSAIAIETPGSFYDSLGLPT